MEATLSQSEMETIAKRVADILHARFVADGSQKELQATCENYTKQIIKFYLAENVITYDAAKVIKPILDEHLKETKVVEQQLSSYMNTEHFKKLELKHLKQRVNQIEQELYAEENND